MAYPVKESWISGVDGTSALQDLRLYLSNEPLNESACKNIMCKMSGMAAPVVDGEDVVHRSVPMVISLVENNKQNNHQVKMSQFAMCL